MKVEIRKLFIIACYGPINGESSEVKDAFWESLKDIASDPEKRIIMLVDMDGSFSVQLEGTDTVVGKFGDPKTNRNGKRLVSLCL